MKALVSGRNFTPYYITFFAQPDLVHSSLARRRFFVSSWFSTVSFFCDILSRRPCFPAWEKSVRAIVSPLYCSLLSLFRPKSRENALRQRPCYVYAINPPCIITLHIRKAGVFVKARPPPSCSPLSPIFSRYFSQRKRAFLLYWLRALPPTRARGQGCKKGINAHSFHLKSWLQLILSIFCSALFILFLRNTIFHRLRIIICIMLLRLFVSIP